jgi:predicted DNA-binding transcriptional regulator YafY
MADLRSRGDLIEHLVEIDYTNYQGMRSLRRVIPYEIRFGTNDWHLEPQWLLVGLDVDKGQFREFALKDMHFWKPAARKDG